MRIVTFLIAMVLSSVTVVHGYELPWKKESFSYYGNGESLTQVLNNFSLSVGTHIIVSDQVTGTLQGAYFAPTAQHFLRQLSERYGLVWYYDGEVLYVYHRNQLQQRHLHSDMMTASELQRRIENHPAWNHRYQIYTDDTDEQVIVTAPPRLMALLENWLEQWKEEESSSLYVSRIFQLRYAWATDKKFKNRDDTIVIPGVVTLLKKIFAGQVPPPKTEQTPHDRTAKGVLENTKNAATETQETNPKPIFDTRNDVRIEADVRLNAIVIHAPRYQMTMYEELIAELDAPAGLIEIEAMVVDVSIEKSDELGISWRLSNDRHAIGYGTIDSSLNAGEVIANVGAGVNFSTLAASGARQFLSRISALKTQGNARVMSRPSVLTIDNFEAVLDLHQTFHVRVAGHEAVELYPITVGTLLKVTPHIIASRKDRGIQLAIAIEDGSILQQTVDNIPIVRNNTINTQAIIGEHQSLLIGGHYYESESDRDEGIPILQDLPLIGMLFSRERTERTRIERLYLITPRIIALPSAMLQN